MKPIGLVQIGYSAFWVTRRWVIPDQYSDIEDFWCDRYEWLDGPFNIEPGTPISVEIYPGGGRFMPKAVRVLKQKGFDVSVRWRDRVPPSESDVYRLTRCATIRPL